MSAKLGKRKDPANKVLAFRHRHASSRGINGDVTSVISNDSLCFEPIALSSNRLPRE
jgi:hypothetical protein